MSPTVAKILTTKLMSSDLLERVKRSASDLVLRTVCSGIRRLPVYGTWRVGDINRTSSVVYHSLNPAWRKPH